MLGVAADRPKTLHMQGRAVNQQAKLQVVLYSIFLVTCVAATVLGLLFIWGVDPSKLLLRVLGTCVVLAVASAFTMSATRLVSGGPPEDVDG